MITKPNLASLLRDPDRLRPDRVGLPARKACQLGQTGTLYVPHAGYRQPDGQRSVSTADRQHPALHAGDT